MYTDGVFVLTFAAGVESAGDEKHRLEEKQRAARRKRHDAKEEWVPRYTACG